MIDQNSPPNLIRVLVVDDHAVVRQGICMLLDHEPDIQIVGNVGSGEEAITFLQARTKEQGTDVVLMDLGLPGMSGIEATRQIKKDDPDLRVLALTMYSDEQSLLGMLDAGAAGYLLKKSMLNDLVEAVRAVSVGECHLDSSATKTVIESLRRPHDKASSTGVLTAREKDILWLTGQGYTSKEIGSKLFLSPKTVENYRARILKKLQARNCTEAVSNAIRLGLIEQRRG